MTPHEPRPDCPSTTHDWPLPADPMLAGTVAVRRLQPRNGWTNERCPDCGRFGWVPGQVDEIDTQVRHEEKETK